VEVGTDTPETLHDNKDLAGKVMGGIDHDIDYAGSIYAPQPKPPHDSAGMMITLSNAQTRCDQSVKDDRISHENIPGSVAKPKALMRSRMGGSKGRQPVAVATTIVEQAPGGGV
jgi:hypothetical protein